MKILFVLPFEKLSTTYYTEPLGIMSLSSVAKQAGHICKASLANWPDLSENIQRFSPDILAFSATTGAHNLYLKLVKQAKAFRPDVFTIFGGPHPTFYPTIIENSNLDAICRGEGEGAFEELLFCMENDKDITKIPNIWSKRKGKIFQNQLRPLITNLDTIPYPDREILEPYFKGTIRYVMMSRGCPFECSYCFNHAFRELYRNISNNKVRVRSVDNVVTELVNISHKYPKTSLFSFVDDTFNVSNVWVDEFCEKYKKRLNLPFSQLCRVDLMTPEIAMKLSGAGCVLMAVGIEAGNDQLRKNILKRNMSKDTIVKGCKMIRDAGIDLQTFNIIGIPPGNLDDDIETIKLNILCAPNIPEAFLMTPFPMTELGEKTREDGYWNTNQYENFFETFVWDQLTQGSNLRLIDKVEIETLLPLFPIAVRFPFLLGLVEAICRLAGRNKWIKNIMGSFRMLGSKYAPPLLCQYMDLYARYHRWKRSRIHHIN